MAIGSFKLPNAIAEVVDPSGWTRPTDWLAMPTIGAQEFIGLLAVTDDESNHIALNCAGAYTVDWGDGTSQNVASGVKAEKSYTYSAISSGTLSTRGYKQVLVRVTPQAGQNLTTVNLQQQNSILAKAHSTGWLDLSINGANITSIAIGGTTVRQAMCERVTIGTIGSTTVFGFESFYSLQSVPLFNTASWTTFASMFSNCYSLKKIPLFNTGLGTSFSLMFNNCYSLIEIPLINTSSGNNFSSMFSNCYSLIEIPLINTSSGNNFSYMFSNCYSLKKIPLFNTGLGTNFLSMFLSCFCLQFLPFINTASGTNFNTMVANCGSLQQLPNINTAAGTSFTSMMLNNNSIAKGAFQGTRYAISYASMCLSQSAIVDIFNGLGTAVGTPTINVSSNPGRSALTAGEILIATGKGWTVV